ncbi:MAG TPA: PAS domain S-box protein [Spirochaetia bacterium]|nr:PAS domain S-box protein [Spirochaetia bacterium]
MDLLPRKCILLVEDDAIIALAETDTLRALGYTVLMAPTGERAVETATGNMDVDLVLMDIDLGWGIDGPEAARQILKRRYVPIVFLTSHAEEEYVNRVREITKYGYVLKNSGDFVLRSSIEMAFEMFEARQAASARERELKKVHSFAHIGSWAWDIREGLLTWSDEVYRILGIPTETASGQLSRIALDAVHPADRAKVEQTNMRAIREKRFIPIKFRVIWPDQSVHTVWAEPAELVVDNAGSPERLTGYVQDITDRTRQENELKQKEHEYGELVENLPGIVYSYSTLRGGIRYSAQAEDILGRPVEEYYRNPQLWRESIHPEHAEEVSAAFRDIEAGKPVLQRYRICDAFGKWHWIEDRVIGYQTVGAELIIHGFAQDITDRKELEENLQREKSLLLTLINNLPDHVAVKDRESRFLITNTANAQVMGLKRPEDAIGRTDLDFYPMAEAEGYLTDEREIVRTGNAMLNKEELTIDPDGSRRWTLTSKVPLRDAEGDIAGIVCTGRDITDRKAAEDRIHALVAEKELILKEVHHRIKNNMSVMESLLSIQAHAAGDEATATALIDARGRLHSMSVLYDKLYRTDNLTDMNLSIYLPDLISEVVRMFPNAGSVKVNTSIQDIRVPVKSMTSLGIIVNELLTNTMKHAFVGKTNGVISVNASKSDGNVIITVEDDGVGMRELPGAETPTGFGLTLVRTLARQLNGRLRAESDRGTRFILEFAL